MKSVLITGCSGYIGSHLCKLLEKDYDVYGLDIAKPQHHVKQFFQIDITQPFAEKQFDAVVHLAALVNVSESEIIPTTYYNTNVNGTLNVLNNIRTENFIFASTGAAELCNSAYGISKRAVEDIIKEYHACNRLKSYTIFRFYNVIGSSGYAPTNPDGLMYKLMQTNRTREFTIFGNDYDTIDGTCVRDYVHVDEICEAIRLAIMTPANKIECLGHGVGYTVKQMFDKFLEVNKEMLYLNDDTEIVHNFGPRRKGDVPRSVLSEMSPYMKSIYSIEDLLRL